MNEITTSDGLSWVPTTEAAKAAGVVPATVRKWAKDKLIESVRREISRPGKRVAWRIYVRIDQVRRLIQRVEPLPRLSKDDEMKIAAFRAYKPGRVKG